MTVMNGYAGIILKIVVVDECGKLASDGVLQRQFVL